MRCARAFMHSLRRSAHCVPPMPVRRSLRIPRFSGRPCCSPIAPCRRSVTRPRRFSPHVRLASALPFHCACRRTALHCTNRSHLEPVPDRCRAVLPAEIACAVRPGVAVGRDCSRLGQGAGYYDRLLPELSCPKAGLAFDFQVLERVPCEEWDVKMDLIAENNGIIVNKMYSCL